MDSHGKITVSTLNQVLKSLERFPLVYPPQLPAQELDPIRYLKDPLPGYARCTICYLGFKHSEGVTPSRTMDKHACNGSWTYGFTQTLYPGKSVARFAVKSPTSSPRHFSSAYYAEYKDQIDARPPITITSAKEDNYRVFDHFLESEKWLAHVESLDEKVIKSLITLPLIEPRTLSLAKHCNEFLLHWQARLTDYHARRLIGSRPT